MLASEAQLKDARALLGDAARHAGRLRRRRADQAALAASIRQLDELFLLVIVGEFNAGKSAFINALIGEPRRSRKA